MWEQLKAWDEVWAERSRQWWAIQFARETWLDWTVLAVAAGFAGWLATASAPAPPGFAIGALGAVAMTMAFSKPNTLQKCAVIFLAVSLFALEMHLISADRKTQQDSAKSSLQAILDDNRNKTQIIIDNAQQQFDATEGKFSDVLSYTKSINKLTTRNLSLSVKDLYSVTGGKSFAYIAAQPNHGLGPVHLIIWNAGNYTLTGVDVIIKRTTIFPWAQLEENIGTIPPHKYREMRLVITPNMNDVKYRPGDRNYFDSYWAFITAQNGLVTEMLEFRPDNMGNWAERSWARREDCVPRIQKCPIGPDFKDPKDINGGLWSDEAAPKSP